VPLQATGTCDILHLTLGPLDLNLLGLVVHLDQVVLDITAEQGPATCWAICSVRSPDCSIRPPVAEAGSRLAPEHRQSAEPDSRSALSAAPPNEKRARFAASFLPSRQRDYRSAATGTPLAS
jgi:hypothetical protein